MFEAAHTAATVRTERVDLQGAVPMLAAFPGTRPQPEHKSAVRDLYVPQQHERRWSVRPGAGGVATEPQQLLQVQTTVAVLHDVYVGPVQHHLSQHDAARSEVKRVVADLGVGQPRDQRGIGIVELDLRQRHPGEQRATHLSQLDRPSHRSLQGLACHGGE